jgi:hypothetical protein
VGSVLIGFTVVLAFLFTTFGIHKHFPHYVALQFYSTRYARVFFIFAKYQNKKCLHEH